MPDVILGNGNTAELGTQHSFGEAAWNLAQEHEIAGDVFTLKVNGDVLHPDATLVDHIEDGDILELIEWVEQEDTGARIGQILDKTEALHHGQ